MQTINCILEGRHTNNQITFAPPHLNVCIDYRRHCLRGQKDAELTGFNLSPPCSVNTATRWCSHSLTSWWAIHVADDHSSTYMITAGTWISISSQISKFPKIPNMSGWFWGEGNKEMYKTSESSHFMLKKKKHLCRYNILIRVMGPDERLVF